MMAAELSNWGHYPTFRGSRLVQVLEKTANVGGHYARQSLSERLGAWLEVGDAISLFSMLSRAPGKGRMDISPETDPCGQLVADLERVREQLRAAIVTQDSPTGAKAGTSLPRPGSVRTGDGAADFSPFHRYYLARQRDMAARIAPLRASFRAALARSSLVLSQLAALDAFFEDALSERERSLLSTIPLLLAERFHQLFKDYSQIAPMLADEDPESWMLPGGWLFAFCAELQTLLLAEIDFRLQPAVALLEALGTKVNSLQ